MKPETQSRSIFSITRSRAKMYEYAVPEEHHIQFSSGNDPSQLFALTIGILGEYSARYNENPNEDLQESLVFSSRFFDAYLESKLNHNINSYVLLLAAASYYLCDLPGCSNILSKLLETEYPELDLGAADLDKFLLNILYNPENSKKEFDSIYNSCLSPLELAIREYNITGEGFEDISRFSSALHDLVYSKGTPRELLFTDVICACITKKYENSAWYSLPEYTDISKDTWRSIIKRPQFLHELWPSQHLLGKHNVFRGRSAIVQMPTSAGKTRATEIVIRSAFLAERTSLSVVIAPYRALCHEITASLIRCFANDPVTINELSDALQQDFDIADFHTGNQILISTPEKFLYLLRHHPELASRIGVAIFDEGHQFDSGTRGITYELLLTSLNMLLPDSCQKLLISAVITNAQQVGEWMNGPESEIVKGKNLSPTFRSIAFTSWPRPGIMGQLIFVDANNINSREFYVPRIIESHSLTLKGRERSPRNFPDRDDSNSIALYLGLKMEPTSGVAIFCPRKSTVRTLCDKLIDAFDRGLPLTAPSAYTNVQENKALHSLYQRHLGETPQTKAAFLGAFTHHGNTPEGIRLAVEYAMRENLIYFVICTSTLAQGVNLPIRYLIVTGVQQGRERIKSRDFHNLMGRAGRAGMHTEGSVIFSNPKIYDNRTNPSLNFSWRSADILLDPDQSDHCLSNLLSLFLPFEGDNNGPDMPMNALDFVEQYVEGPQIFQDYVLKLSTVNGFSESGLQSQVAWRTHLITAIESFLMTHLNPETDQLFEEQARALAERTYAYYLASDTEKETVLSCFTLLANRIEKEVNNTHTRTIYSRTLLGLNDTIEISNWTTEHFELLSNCSTQEELLEIVWPCCQKFITNRNINRCVEPDMITKAALHWINGVNFTDILNFFIDNDIKLHYGENYQKFDVDIIVDICQNGFAYDSALIIGAICETSELIESEGKLRTIQKLRMLQKSMKYGLPPGSSIELYEKILPDRIIASDIASLMDLTDETGTTLMRILHARQEDLFRLLSEYPSYFQTRARQYFAPRVN